MMHGPMLAVQSPVTLVRMNRSSLLQHKIRNPPIRGTLKPTPAQGDRGTVLEYVAMNIADVFDWFARESMEAGKQALSGNNVRRSSSWRCYG
jgi:hypothetical protein